MRFAIRTPEGKYINIIRPEYTDHQPCFDFKPTYPLFILADRPDQVFYMKGDLFLAASHQGAKGFEPLKDFQLRDDQGTTYVLDWKNMKIGAMPVASVPVKEIVKRKLPDHLIPEVWKGHKQIYIDNFAIKVHPFDYCLHRFEESGYDVKDMQSVVLDAIYYAIGRYISGLDANLRFVNKKIQAVDDLSEREDIPKIVSLIKPLCLDPIERLLLDNEVLHVHARLVSGYRKITDLIEKLSVKYPTQPFNE